VPEIKALVFVMVLTVVLAVVLRLVFVMVLRLGFVMGLGLGLRLEFAMAGLEAKGLRTSSKGSEAAGCHHPTW
jgi:hypothetical protein